MGLSHCPRMNLNYKALPMDVVEARKKVTNICSTVKPVYNDHLMGYFFAFWGSSRWPKAI